jgi:hypothetical protein
MEIENQAILIYRALTNACFSYKFVIKKLSSVWSSKLQIIYESITKKIL